MQFSSRARVKFRTGGIRGRSLAADRLSGSGEGGGNESSISAGGGEEGTTLTGIGVSGSGRRSPFRPSAGCVVKVCEGCVVGATECVLQSGTYRISRSLVCLLDLPLSGKNECGPFRETKYHGVM